MTELALYMPPDSAVWTGRVDDLEDRDAFRWHQVVELLDLASPADELALCSDRGFCLLGYCCDHGVELNLGRTGTARGPAAIRRQLANMPVNFPGEIGLLDGGNIHCRNADLEGAQRCLAEVVDRVLSLPLIPIVLGGGHDLAFGHYQGIRHHISSGQRLGILSFDAHLDLRPLRPAANSGTMFTQIAAGCHERGMDFSYLCVGAQKSANTVSLFRSAEELGVETVFARDVNEADLMPISRRLDSFLAGTDAVYVTICADVFSSAFAPGVSAPQPFGLHPETVMHLLKHVLSSGKVVSFDFAEVSPRFD